MSANKSKPEKVDLMKNLQDSIDAARAARTEYLQALPVLNPAADRDQARETEISSKTGDQHFGAVDGLAWVTLRDRAWALLARSLPGAHGRVTWHAHPRVYALMRRVPTAPGSPTTGIEVRPPSTVDTGIRLYLFGIRVIESAQVEDLALVIPA